MNFFAKTYSRAFSLVESAIVLAVIGLIVAGIWAAYASLNEQQKVTATITQVFTIAKGLQGRISAANALSLSNATSITSFAVNSGSIPQDMISGNSIRSLYGTAVTLTVFNATPAAPRFDIYLAAIPRTACIKLVAQITQLAAISDPAYKGTTGPMDRLGLGYIATNAGAWASTTFPVSLAMASTACSQTTNQITLTFGFPA